MKDTIFFLRCVDLDIRSSGKMSLVFNYGEGIDERQYNMEPRLGKRLRVGNFYTANGFEDYLETGIVTEILRGWVFGGESFIEFVDSHNHTYIWGKSYLTDEVTR